MADQRAITRQIQDLEDDLNGRGWSPDQIRHALMQRASTARVAESRLSEDIRREGLRLGQLQRQTQTMNVYDHGREAITTVHENIHASRERLRTLSNEQAHQAELATAYMSIANEYGHVNAGEFSRNPPPRYDTVNDGRPPSFVTVDNYPLNSPRQGSTPSRMPSIRTTRLPPATSLNTGVSPMGFSALGSDMPAYGGYDPDQLYSPASPQGGGSNPFSQRQGTPSPTAISPMSHFSHHRQSHYSVSPLSTHNPSTFPSSSSNLRPSPPRASSSRPSPPREEFVPVRRQPLRRSDTQAARILANRRRAERERLGTEHSSDEEGEYSRRYR